MPGPLGITTVAFNPPGLTSSPTYTDLLNETMGDTGAALDSLQRQTETLTALQAAFELDVPNLDADISALDSIVASADEVLQPDPADDLPAISDFVTGQAGPIPQLTAQLADLGTVPLALPSGAAGTTLGGPPEQGGTPTAGAQPYTLHLPLPFAGVAPGTFTIDSLDGDNPPFMGVQGWDVEPGGDGKDHITVLIQINPVTPGTYRGTLHGHFVITITGISGPVQFNYPFMVTVTQ